MPSIKQNLYIRKSNGLGQKIYVQNNLTIKQLKQIIRSLKSISQSEIKQKDFSIIFKGKNITEKSQYSLKQLNIPSDGIIHLLFNSQSQNNYNLHSSNLYMNNNNGKLLNNNSAHVFSQSTYIKVPQPEYNSAKNINITINQPHNMNMNMNNNNINNINNIISLRIIFNQSQHTFLISIFSTILQLKRQISIKLNLVYQSLVLSHLGTQMINEKLIKDYYLSNNTLISLKFNIQRLEKKKLQTRLVNSVTFSDQNNQPNKLIAMSSNNKNNVNIYTNNSNKNTDLNNKFMISSSKSINSDKEQLSKSNSSNNNNTNTNNNTNNSNINSITNKTMYKSDINTLSSNYNHPSSSVSKAALMFKTALHQKIAQTQSIVSGSFSQDTNNPTDPNILHITVRNQQQTKQYIFECLKTHQIKDIKEMLIKIERVKQIQISLQEDLFQSIDLNKSGSVDLNEIVKKMGKERAIMIYREINNIID